MRTTEFDGTESTSTLVNRLSWHCGHRVHVLLRDGSNWWGHFTFSRTLGLVKGHLATEGKDAVQFNAESIVSITDHGHRLFCGAADVTPAPAPAPFEVVGEGVVNIHHAEDVWSCTAGLGGIPCHECRGLILDATEDGPQRDELRAEWRELRAAAEVVERVESNRR